MGCSTPTPHGVAVAIHVLQSLRMAVMRMRGPLPRRWNGEWSILLLTPASSGAAGPWQSRAVRPLCSAVSYYRL